MEVLRFHPLTFLNKGAMTRKVSRNLWSPLFKKNYCCYWLEALLLVLLVSWPGSVQAGEATAEGESEAMAQAQAKRQVPQGKTVTDVSCISFDVAMSTRYRCTASWAD